MRCVPLLCHDGKGMEINALTSIIMSLKEITDCLNANGANLETLIMVNAAVMLLADATPDQVARYGTRAKRVAYEASAENRE